MHQRRGSGYQDFPSKIFRLNAENFRRGESFSVSLISGIEKVWIRGGGEYQDFLSKIFLSHSAENFRTGILYCCNNLGYLKSLDKGGGGVSRFSVEVFVSLYRNISLENTLVFQKNSSIDNFHA